MNPLPRPIAQLSLLIVACVVSVPALALHSWSMDFLPAENANPLPFGPGSPSFEKPVSGSWIRVNTNVGYVYDSLNGSLYLQPEFERFPDPLQMYLAPGFFVFQPISFPVFGDALFGFNVFYPFEPPYNPPYSCGPADPAFCSEITPGIYSIDFSGFDMLIDGVSVGAGGVGATAQLTVVSSERLDGDSDSSAPLYGYLDYSFVNQGQVIDIHLSSVATVPLPPAFWLFAAGAVLIGGFRRIKRP